MKAVLVFLLVSLTVANVSSMPFQQGQSAKFFQFFEKLMAMYRQSQIAGSTGSNTGGTAGGHTGSIAGSPTGGLVRGRSGGSTGRSAGGQVLFATCDLDDCVPRGTCESLSDVKAHLTCVNPNFYCCDQ